ncbi:hypothetical protein, partial [Raoultella planticola]|uniref:hypothetical protein n=1 Tax=Raoultella planticola TaxID=575 RepID=UPI00195452FE
AQGRAVAGFGRMPGVMFSIPANDAFGDVRLVESPWLQSAALKIGLPAEPQWDPGLTPRRCTP